MKFYLIQLHFDVSPPLCPCLCPASVLDVDVNVDVNVDVDVDVNVDVDVDGNEFDTCCDLNDHLTLYTQRSCRYCAYGCPQK